MKKRQDAFTLLEIMLVVAIIGVLLAAAIYKMAPALDVAKGMRTKADIQSLRTSLMSYNGANGFYPSSEQGLSALVSRPGSEPAGLPNSSGGRKRGRPGIAGQELVPARRKEASSAAEEGAQSEVVVLERVCARQEGPVEVGSA